jgi:uncharacterized protein (UPF0335 family)
MAQLVALDAQALKKLSEVRKKLLSTQQSESDALMQNYISAAQENKEYQRALDLQIRLVDV